MFETAELGRKLGKKEYADQVPPLRTELIEVQNELHQSAPFSVIVVIAGVDAAGKGETVNVLHEWMDPRYLETHAWDSPTDEERERPLAWRYWRVLPPKGTIAIFFGSWYTQAIEARHRGELDNTAFEHVLSQVNDFERELTDNGTLLVKFWFHIDKKTQKKRLKKFAADPTSHWRVTERDRNQLKHYDELMPICDQALRETSTSSAPWTVVEGTDRRYREVAAARHLFQAIREHMQRPAAPPPIAPSVPAEPLLTGQPTILSALKLDQSVDRDEYQRELPRLQSRINRLACEARERGVSAVMVFEGWDGAGKGGAIRRVTQALDARQYHVVPVAAPTDEEQARHYLWRFWRRLPRAGRFTIFDRSWYGRVLVERVEGFAREDEWRRAYKEINDFEELLVDRGMAVLKFWLQIDKDEQGKRFAERELVPYKQFKITADDYRNREKWELYELAVNEMVERTSTALTPWTLVESNDKRYARCKVLRECIAGLERALAKSK